MFSSIRFLAAVIALIIATEIASAQVYVVGENRQFGYFDVTTRAYTEVNATVSTQNPRNLAYNSATDTLYLTTTPGSSSNTSLRTVTTAGVTSATLGTIGHAVGGMSFSSGTLYSWNAETDNLETLNPANGAPTNIGPFGKTTVASRGGRMAFHNGTQYASLNVASPTSDTGLYSVNTATGAVTRIGTESSSYTNMILFSAEGNLYGLSGTNLFQIDTSTGSTSNQGALSGTNLPLGFAGAAFVPVPEPATVLGIGVAALGLVGWVRRRQTR